jgi:pimeloyl-ACP methyl ester carboxylesterase
LETQPKHHQAVALLHGILLSNAFMGPLALHLRRRGFKTFNFSYASRSHKIETLANHIFEKLKEHDIESFDHIHFVGHSMGGLIIEELLQHHKFGNLGRVVMIGTPHFGSELANALQNKSWYQRLFGPAGQQLTTHARENWADYRADYPLGSIAGTTQPFYWPANKYFTGDHDGRVAVSSTKVPGMADHICLPFDHTALPFMPKTSHQVSTFLEKGAFDHK